MVFPAVPIELAIPGDYESIYAVANVRNIPLHFEYSEHDDYGPLSSGSCIEIVSMLRRIWLSQHNLSKRGYFLGVYDEHANCAPSIPVGLNIMVMCVQQNLMHL